MGCGMFLDIQESMSTLVTRENKKTQKIDCRRKSSQAQNTIYEHINIIGEITDEDNINFVCTHLKEHSLFCTLEKQELREVARSMKLATALKDSYILNEGDKGSCFFLIKNGEVDVEISANYIRTIGAGQCFGQLALIYCTTRTAAIKCKSDNLELIVIKAREFKQTMRNIREKNNERTRSLIQNVHIFWLLTSKQKYILLHSLVRQHYKQGTILFKKDDHPVSFYIIQSGQVSLIFNDTSKKDITLGAGQSFGESAFKPNAKREGTAKVVTDLVCLTINEAKMKESLGGTLPNVVYHNIKKWALKSSPLFYNYDNRELDQIALQFSTKFAKTNDIIMDIEKPVDALIISIEGNINSKPVGTLFNDSFYDNKGKLDVDLIKSDNGVYAFLSFSKLQVILKEINTKGSVAVLRKRQSMLMEQNTDVLNINQFNYIAKLGSGQFGSVYLVKDRRLGNLFALKCLEKEKIKKEGMEESAISQREILASLCHPLIVGYYAAYQDKKNVCFLLEYIDGVEMFEAIREIGILNKATNRYYLGSIILAVEHLHSKNIIYRDIKPENSIVNYQGKVFLIDLGTAKVLSSDNGYRTSTIIGTPHYMAPEVMQGKGYSFQADYWSLGVLFYQLVCGTLPFAEKIENPYQVYEEVMKKKVHFPDFFTDKLLNKSIQQRGLGGLQGIKNSQYFDGFNWQDLYEGNIPPPFIPRKYRGSFSNNQKFQVMQGYPLNQFFYPVANKGKDRKVEQVFEAWTNKIIK